MPDAGKTAPIKDIVSSVIASLTGEAARQGRLSQEQVEGLWRKAAGTPASRRSAPVSLRKGKLVISVGDSSLLYDLTLRKREILKNLTRDSNGKVYDIQFRIGEVSGEKKSKAKSQKSKKGKTN